MRLHVLGCHGPYPNAGGAPSGYLVESGEIRLLMDCGSGVMGRLMAKCDPASLSAVLLSHLHFDHASDLLVLRYYLEIAGKELPLYLPGEDKSKLRSVLEESAYRVTPYPEELRIGDLMITTLPVRHPVPCRALKITDGERTLVFTGDTNTCPGLSEFACGADVLLADAAFLESEWTEQKPHLSVLKAAELAKEAGVKKLYLTHLPVRHEAATLEKEARAVFEDACAVKPGTVISL